MTEAVIVATARPDWRAERLARFDSPDDLSAQIVKALMAKVPSVSASDVEDLIMGCGQPAGEAGFNIARVTACLPGLMKLRVSRSTAIAHPRCRPFAWLPTLLRPAKETALSQQVLRP